MILVDTDVLIEIFDKNSEKGEKALKKIEETEEDITTTSLNLHKYTNHAKLERILVLDAVEFTKDDAVLSSKLEVETEKKGKKVPRFDAMIAAVAINRGFKLFTFNMKHFKVFRDLTLV